MDFRESEQVGAGDMAVMDMERPETATSEKSDTAGKSAKAGAAPKDNAPDSKSVAVRRFDVATDSARDALLTDFGKETLKDRYLLPGESYQDLFARVASAYADDQDHAQRIYDYIS
ncbi:MAG: ribonucleotide-diphosphate reductase subunit alpha, partial [Sphingobium sp.]|nr:ribonucleotide-diphosphate reductase subunit alpha [Sphingobium sp.]